MSHTNFVTAFAKLLSSPALRASFRSNPSQVADIINIRKKDVGQFIALSPDQIDTQAMLLITKRKREVYKFLPQTFKLLNNNVSEIFKEYASNNWPSCHNRHLEDAYSFCNYLRKRRLPINRSEFNQVKFLRSRRMLGLAVASDTPINNERYPAIQLFYRHNGRTGQFRLFLKA